MMKRKQKTTDRSRADLAVPKDYRKWRDLPASFEEHKLIIGGHPVMEDWERGYMLRLAEVSGSKVERVLEVGFGMGISAGYLQRFEIGEHIIVEANRSVYERLVAFASSAPRRVVPVLGFWEEVTGSMPDGSVSSILFDVCPLRESDLHRCRFAFFREAYRLLKKGGVLTYYSGEAEDFSPQHEEALREAGFRDIRKEVCEVHPQEDCPYWQEKTLIVPIIFK